MRTRIQRVLLTLLSLCTPICASQRDNGMELGELGTVYPQPADVISEDALVNQDEIGGAQQELLSLAGMSEGFAGVWRDTRNGNLGLFLGLLDPAGERLAEERSVNQPLTSRQFSPAVAIGPGLLGGVVWFLSSQGRHQPKHQGRQQREHTEARGVLAEIRQHGKLRALYFLCLYLIYKEII